MKDITSFSINELVDALRLLNGADMIDVPHPLIDEAIDRLSRYAPVKIDPEDESTWPTEEDGFNGFVEIWGTWKDREGGIWESFPIRHLRNWLEQKHPSTPEWWRRINNERPE